MRRVLPASAVCRRIRMWYVFCLLSLCLLLAGCSGHDVIPAEQTTQEGAVTLVLKGYESISAGFSVCRPEGFTYPFYIQNRSFYGEVYRFVRTGEERLDTMQEIPLPGDGWQSSIGIEEKAVYWAWCMAPDRYRFVKFRVISIDGNDVIIEYVVADAPEGNLNANAGDGNVSATRYEMPCLNDSNRFVVHEVSVSGVRTVNYALEWNAEKKHANWVAFSFDTATATDVVTRTDAWAVDPELPAEMQTEEADYRNDGFDKGHLCASEDRVYMEEANRQTFYYSNISPQLNDFNGGFWRGLEAQVRQWGRAVLAGTYEEVYVVKGGTLNDLLTGFTGTPVSGGTPATDIYGRTVHGLACPAYYFMAVMSRKGTEFHSIAFLVPHREGLPRNPEAEDLQQYVLSVDELERVTGIDFFCNVDDIWENQAEKEVVLEEWEW